MNYDEFTPNETTMTIIFGCFCAATICLQYKFAYGSVTGEPSESIPYIKKSIAFRKVGSEPALLCLHNLQRYNENMSKLALKQYHEEND